MLVWAVHNGGYDEDTWYWGALAMLALTTGTVFALGGRGLRLSRSAAIATGLFALYTAWSYLSITWASYKGIALEGSNKTLLYLLMFGLLAALPWTERGALTALLAFAVGVGTIAIVLLVRLAAGSHVTGLFVGGRLAAPTGYINSTAALLTMGVLTAIALAARRELWGPVRGLLLACAAAELDLAITVQSRGWLFTLPLVALVAIVVSPARLRVTAAAVLPVVGSALVARRLLHVYQNTPSDPLQRLAEHAGRPALALCVAVFVVGTLFAWADGLRPVALGSIARRITGAILVIVALGGGAGVVLAVSHGHPGSFISRQWHGFSHEPSANTDSHFSDAGSGRYDFWRVSLKAFEAHPVGGLGQDNFGDYYLRHRHTGEEPVSPHSLEMRLLSQTGVVGTVLFVGFMAAAIAGALRARRRGSDLGRAVAAAALLPLIVWLIHGSIDWFWEMPSLSGPALGFLAIAGAWADREPDGQPTRSARRTIERARGPLVRRGAIGVGSLAALAALVVLAFPYLSVREVSIATNIQNVDPVASLHDLHIAGRLNPLDSGPGLVAGAVALRHGEWAQARRSLGQSTGREPGDWLAWLLAGVAASEQGRRSVARVDYVRADKIDRLQPAVMEALARVGSRRPLTSAEVFRMLVPAA